MRWTSARNGYSAKQFRVDAGTDKSNLDVLLVLTEVDPDDYDWDRDTDLQPVTTGGLISNPPPAQGVTDWNAQPYQLLDDSGVVRRPAILISWDGSQPGVGGVQFEVRLASDGSSVTRGRTDRVSAGSLIITQSILPAVTYQVRGQYLPSTPRDMLWSDWITVTTADIRLSLAEFDAAVSAQVTTIFNQLSDKVDRIEQDFASRLANLSARGWNDKTEVRTQYNARAEVAAASIEDVRIVAVNASEAFASYTALVTATWGSLTAFVQESANAIATLDGYAAASYGVAVSVDGYVIGTKLINGGPGLSSFAVQADKFQFQFPGYNGGLPQDVFAIGAINGVAAVGIRGNLNLDGTFNVKAIAAGAIDVIYLKANSIDSASGVIKNLGVGSLSIADNAVTVPVAQTTGAAIFGAGFGNWVSFFSFNMSIDTTGLSGKPIVIYVSVNSMWASGSPATETGQFRFLLNGSQVNYYQVTLPTGASAPTPLSGAISITGTGGIVSVSIAAQFGSTSSNAMLAGATSGGEAMNIHYNVTTGQIMSYGYGADHGDGFETSHFEGCKVLIVDNQTIDAKTQMVDPVSLAIVDKTEPDPDPFAIWQVKAAVRQELIDTDYLLLPHAPVSETDLPAWVNYRKALRDSSKGNDTAAAMLAAVPARPNGIDALAWLREQLDAASAAKGVNA
ncbi:hypothetical protein [Bradyrhizobium sp. LA2.1]|uniref:hypothetical protein n=1 Tax=Bradyrhizobium sp. LA2.1 TaxID=3156376 RepID=UPI003391D85E